MRFSEVLPFPDQNDESNQDTVFATSYASIADFLDQDSKFWTEHSDAQKLRREFDEIQAAWTNAIPPSAKHSFTAAIRPARPHSEIFGGTSPEGEEDDGTEHENAVTLSQIEFINRQFEKQESRTRLAFVTTTGRIFEAAASRFGAPLQTRRVKFGTRGMFKKAEYFEKLNRKAATDFGFVPLVDPRCLIVGSDFVNFANRQNSTDTDDQSRAISSWVPIFFKNYLAKDGFLDVKSIFSVYSGLQILPASPVNTKSLRAYRIRRR